MVDECLAEACSVRSVAGCAPKRCARCEVVLDHLNLSGWYKLDQLLGTQPLPVCCYDHSKKYYENYIAYFNNHSALSDSAQYFLAVNLTLE